MSRRYASDDCDVSDRNGASAICARNALRYASDCDGANARDAHRGVNAYGDANALGARSARYDALFYRRCPDHLRLYQRSYLG